MRSALVLLAVLAAACGSTAVGGNRPGSGGEGGSGGSGGTGGAGGTGGEGGTGGSGGSCAGGEGPSLFLVPEPFGSARVQVTGRVVEHRDVAPEERPRGAYGVERLLAIEPTDPGVPTQRLYYGVPEVGLAPHAAIGDTVALDYQLYQPFGTSVGATLRSPSGLLFWAAEAGGFGALGTGGPELEWTVGGEVCATAGDCGTTHQHRAVASVYEGAWVVAAPGETVEIVGDLRMGSFYLGSLVRRDGNLCPDMPTEEAHYVLDLPLPPGECGPTLGRSCGEGEFCDFVGDSCGRDGEAGVCRPRPDFCLGETAPVCGCDGTWYWDSCRANQGGTDTGTGCTPPLDTFACGTLACASYTQYCLFIVSDVVGIPDQYECRALPDRCHDDPGETPTCACLADEPCGDFCSGTFPDLTLTCPGG